jgi:hypothetical protein
MDAQYDLSRTFSWLVASCSRSSGFCSPLFLEHYPCPSFGRNTLGTLRASLIAVLVVVLMPYLAATDSLHDYGRIHSIHKKVNGPLRGQWANPTASLEDCKIDPVLKYPTCNLYHRSTKISVMSRIDKRDVKLAALVDLSRKSEHSDVLRLWTLAYDAASALPADRKLEMLTNMQKNIPLLAPAGGNLSFASGDDRIELVGAANILLLTVYANYR